MKIKNSLFLKKFLQSFGFFVRIILKINVLNEFLELICETPVGICSGISSGYTSAKLRKFLCGFLKMFAWFPPRIPYRNFFSIILFFSEISTEISPRHFYRNPSGNFKGNFSKNICRCSCIFASVALPLGSPFRKSSRNCIKGLLQDVFEIISRIPPNEFLQVCSHS